MTWSFFDKRGFLVTDEAVGAYPVGIMLPFVSVSGPTPSVPSGWLLCDGSSVSSGTYQELGEILTGSVAHPYNFNLPNMSTAFPMGGINVSAINTTDISFSRYRHSHGGASSSHSHTNTHTHSVPNHVHNVPHYHFNPASGHTHGAGTLRLSSATNTGAIGTASATGATDISKGYGSGDRHYHDIFGSTDEPNSAMALKYSNDLSNGSGSATSSGGSVAFNNAAIPVNPPISDILPPYLNVYFIIKSVSYTGP